jgi:predicted Ser/Thr protein kinase
VLFGFLVYRASMEFTQTPALEFTEPSFLLHFLSAACFFIIWLLTFRGRRSASYVRWVETLGLLAGAGLLMMMGLYIPLWVQPQYIVTLAITYAVILRSVYVPSSALRTLVLGLWIGAELVCTVYWIYLDIDVEKWQELDPLFSTATPTQIAGALAINTAAWWAITLFTAVVASRVIYGLRRDVRHAKQLGQYKLERKIGEGGMGVVYQARHALLCRPTAVKLLLPEKTGANSMARFEREVRLTAKLRHPNTVTVFDYGHTPDGTFYYAMELIDGGTLSDVVEKTGALDAGRVLHIIEQVAAALVEAHGVGLIHRDIKPANIMVHMPHAYGGIHENAKVLDFGLVKEIDSTDITYTLADSITGTPQYMAPEAIRSPKSADGRSDIYALGCVAYYLLTGSHVFEGSSVMDICAKHLKDVPVAPSERLGSKIPADVEEAVLRCLEKSPDDRPEDAAALQRLLRNCAAFRTFSAHDAQEWWEEYGLLFCPSEGGDVSPIQSGLTIDPLHSTVALTAPE